MKKPSLGYTPRNEWKSWERLQNPKTGAVHLRRGDEIDDETTCGQVIPDDWIPFDDRRISCQSCCFGTAFRDDDTWTEEELGALGMDDRHADLLEMIAGDESDGFYHAMAWELQQGE